MTEKLISVDTLVVYKKESKATFVHYTDHTLNLAMQNAMQIIDKIRDFLSTLRSLKVFKRDSPKRRAIFNSLQAE